MESQLHQLLAAELLRRAAASDNSNNSASWPERSLAGGEIIGSNIGNNTSNNVVSPYALHGLLNDIENAGSTGIIAWTPDGKSFRIQNDHLFASTILRVYFPQLGEGASGLMKFKSELLAWGFESVENGMFMHPCFQREDVSMCRFLRRDGNDEPNEGTRARPQPQLHQPDTLGAPADLLQQLLSPQQSSAVLQLRQLLQGAANPSPPGVVNNTLAPILLAQLFGHQPQHQQNPVPYVSRPCVLSIPDHHVTAASNTSRGSPPAKITQPLRNAAPTVPQPKSILSAEREATTHLSLQEGKIKSKTTGNVIASAKLQAFLKKRSRSTALIMRSSSKKSKASIAESSSGERTLSGSQNSIVLKNTFVLNEDFHQGDVPDLLFLWRLHDVLDDAEKDETLKSIISWNSDAASFQIHDETRFQDEVMATYFDQRAWESFSEALSHWGFVRFTSGAQEGSFIHRLFVKGRRTLCKQMRIQGKSVSELLKCHGQFLRRLHALLAFAEKSGKASIVSWTPDGKAFTIHDPNAFMNDAFTAYFDVMTYGSLEQKLKRWGFSRSPAKIDKINKDTKLMNLSYSHPCFQKAVVPCVSWKKSPATKLSKARPDHNFLLRLRVMLNDSINDGNQLTVSWLPHGKAFMIHDRSHFSDSILPSYFKTKFTSFRQALRNHGFAQMGGNNWDEGAFYHKLFVRDEPLLCQGLTQDQMKNAMPDYIPSADEPNFYRERKYQDSCLLDAANSMVSLKGYGTSKQ